MADRIVVMDHGVIEQVGTPEEIYGSPASAFVADFIGTMNFVGGRVVASDCVRVEGIELACDTGGLPADSRVTVAIRPEDIVIQDVQGTEENALEVEIGLLEFLGSFVRARLDAKGIGNGALLADLSINLVRRLDLGLGRRLSVVLPRERIRIYPATGHG
jgi:iron(III) transport system ATP-binding protein